MTPSEREYELDAHLQNIHKGANWFYWIVGLSLVNVALSVFGADVHFIIGLAYAELASGLMVLEGEGVVVKVVGAVFAFIILGGFMLIGRKAHKPSKGWFMAGIILYGLDGLIYLYFADYLPAIFHAYVLYNLIMGYRSIEPYNNVLNTTTGDVFTEAEVTTVPATAEVAAEPVAEITTGETSTETGTTTESATNTQ